MKVAFQTTSSLLSEIASDYLNNEDDLSGGGRKIEMKDNLVVEFNNTAKQVFQICRGIFFHTKIFFGNLECLITSSF